ncbi:peptidylprolyl isomerase [Simplicispira hankyongi]|uniref:peptidylprolyl isomerase n=1 Tax=Simplicispira hankyongi TaxID=2315688 RepID=A0A398C5E0_9BURK|nr:peptidylprolyl isomerase [Simplicispira hankyongi]
MSGCGSGSCGCSDTPSANKVLSDAQQAAYDAIAVSLASEPAPMQAAHIPAHVRLARVNGVALHDADVVLDQEALRQRACTELLRQEAQKAGLLDMADAPLTDGSTSEAASLAIEQLLEQQLRIDEPSEDTCRRYYDAHPAAFGQGERVHLRHVLFAVTPGVDVTLLRLRAEALLIELRCADDGGATFATAAKQWSNCPSGAAGGDLGWLTRNDCAPEFARDIFGTNEIGVLARLVHSRFGLHVVEVVARQAGERPAFEAVKSAAAQSLRQQTWVNALRQYLQVLTGAAQIEGVDMEGADSPLVQ